MNTLLIIAAVISSISTPTTPTPSTGHEMTVQIPLRVWSGFQLGTQDLREQVSREIEVLLETSDKLPSETVYVSWNNGKRSVKSMSELNYLLDDNDETESFSVAVIYPIQFQMTGNDPTAMASLRRGLWFTSYDAAYKHYMDRNNTSDASDVSVDMLTGMGYFVGEHPQKISKSTRALVNHFSINGIKKLIMNNQDASILLLCALLFCIVMPIYISFNKEKNNGSDKQEGSDQLFPSGSEIG